MGSRYQPMGDSAEETGGLPGPGWAGLCHPLAPLAAVGVPTSGSQRSVPQLRRPDEDTGEVCPGPGHTRWAALCMVPAHPGA